MIQFVIQFNPETFSFGMDLEMADWKTWDMVVAALERVKSYAEFQLNMVRAAQMQAQAQNQQATNNLRRNLRL